VTPGVAGAADHWRDRLDAWAIPDEIVANAPEPPWGFPTELFRRRGQSLDAEPTPTTRRGLDVLPNGGTVLDVGVGGGATSLPLAGRAGMIIGVDSQTDMLEGFLENAAAAGVTARGVHGEWPEVASEVEPADVALAGHVFYNIADLAPFALTLGERARHRVVAELTERHPLEWMGDLWMRFHSLERPDGPTSSDAETVLRELGLSPGREERKVSPEGPSGFARRRDAIHLVRRRLCLTADRDPEIEEALGHRLRRSGGLWDVGPPERTIVTLWWDTGHSPGSS
jgi:SAM-dependent methyltransferase